MPARLVNDITLLKDDYDKLIAALQYQVKRGHFVEMYEGFNNCPKSDSSATEEELKELACICGVTQAMAVLELLEEDVPDIGDWNEWVVR